MDRRTFKKRGRRKSVKFNPSHQYIEDSVQEYLKKGGKITKIEKVAENIQNFISMPDSNFSVDDFLFDR